MCMTSSYFFALVSGVSGVNTQSTEVVQPRNSLQCPLLLKICMNIYIYIYEYIYFISSWVNILICLKAKIPVVVPCSPRSS